jgi:hypothetical protein
MSVLFQRARASGVCPPSLLSELGSALDNFDGFDVSVDRILDRTGKSMFCGACTDDFEQRLDPFHSC